MEKMNGINKTKNPIKLINLSKINNKSNIIDEIKIDDIIKSNSYSINSLLEYQINYFFQINKKN